MEIWTYLEIAAWIVSGLLGAHMIYDWGHTDGRYSEEMLTSSSEGELEAMSEDRKG